MRNAVKRIFEKENYRVLMAKDAMELSKILEDTRLDLILLDVNLPWVDGYELCQLIKSQQFLMLKHIPLFRVIKPKKTFARVTKQVPMTTLQNHLKWKILKKQLQRCYLKSPANKP